MKKQQKMMLFAGLLCLICVSMSVTVGVVASAETEENEETGETTPTSNTTPAAMTTASTPGGDCVGAWSEFGDCSQECSYNDSKGTQSRTYAITTEAGDGGNACPHTDGEEEKQECGMTACTPMDCVGDWDAWKVQGTNQTRDWTITQEPKYGGAECDVAESARTETKACTDATACPPVNCVGSWVNVGTCSTTCGPGGKQNKRYDVSTPASGIGGVACSDADGATKQESCNTDVVCPVDCVGSYNNFSSCSATCGPGTKRRTYSVTTPAVGTGAACAKDDGYEDTQACEDKACDVDCEGKWEFVNNKKYDGGARVNVMKWKQTKAKEGNGKDCKWAFVKKNPDLSAKDGTTTKKDKWGNDIYCKFDTLGGKQHCYNKSGFLMGGKDYTNGYDPIRWGTEVVTDGQKAELFDYGRHDGWTEDGGVLNKQRYCMRKEGVRKTQGIRISPTGAYIKTAVDVNIPPYGPQNVKVWCDDPYDD